MVEESIGGGLGDLLLTKAGLAISGTFLTLLGIVLLFSFLFKANAEDFKQAQLEGKSIQCMGLIKDYKISSDKYSVSEDKIIMKRMLLNKKFNINDCSIEN